MLESPSQTISTEALLRWIYQAEVEAARSCKAMYLNGLQDTYEGALSGFDQSLMLRLQQGRVERQESGVWYGCQYRTLAENNYAERGGTGRASTPMRPAYTYETGEVNVFPGPDPTVRIHYIKFPEEIAVTDVPSTPSHVAGADSLSVSWVLAGRVEAHVTALAKRSLRRVSDHDAQRQLASFYEAPFTRSLRIGRPEQYGRSRVDEPDENTEF